MKACAVFSSLLTLSYCSVLHAVSNQTTPMYRRGMKHGKGKKHRRSKAPCVAFEMIKEYEDRRRVDEPLGCELQGDDLNGRQYWMVRIKGLRTSWARKNKVKSGASTIFVPDGAFINDETSELVIPPGATIEVATYPPNRRIRDNTSQHGNIMDPIDLYGHRKLLSTVTRKVIVIRIEGQDAATTASEAQLADDIFGASGDVLNLKSGYNGCSYGELQFDPLTTDPIGTDGVYTVNLPDTIVTGSDSLLIADAALTKARTVLGESPPFLADHVMLCLPPGTSGGGWIAYAYVAHWMTVYNDVWCQSPSVQIHEIGHNLNLAHSGEGSEEYGDQSCLMGYSYVDDDAPAMCFNGAKTWQLGWFASFYLDLPVGDAFNWKGNLVGFADKAYAANSDRMIIRIRSSTDYYVHFNRRIRINAGTQEGGDMVLVSSREPGSGFAQSYLLAKLSKGGVFTIPNFNGSSASLKITITAITLTTLPARAAVSVQFGSLNVTPPPSPSMKPTLKPTLKPTPKPTAKMMKRR